ncbi:MAG: universal stress protein [Candidatus Obscuribacterales bacterium]|nr:universal stress protein [Candidatus Obscuribacterales bacterium]
MKVIIAIDESVYSKKVLEEVAARKWPADTAFKILSVVEPVKLDEVDCDNWSLLAKEAFSRREKFADKLCMEGREMLSKKHPDCNFHVEVRKGDPRHEIIEAAVDWMADKILIGAHGHDLCERFVWGGVSRAIAMKAPCSVEVVRPRAKHPRTDKKGKLASTKA